MIPKPLTFRPIAHEVRAARYHAPRLEQDPPWLGNAVTVAEVLYIDDPSVLTVAPPAGEGEEPGLLIPAAAILADEDLVLPDGSWIVWDENAWRCPAVVDADAFRKLYTRGGVSELEGQEQLRSLEDRLFEADMFVRRASPAIAQLSHGNDRMFAHSEILDRWTEPSQAGRAVVEMVRGRGDETFTIEKLTEMADRCAGRTTGEDDDEDDGPWAKEAAREDFQSFLARRAWGWLIQVSWGSRIADRGSVMCGWGVETTAWFWAPTFYEALEEALATIDAEGEKAHAKANEWRAANEKGA